MRYLTYSAQEKSSYKICILVNEIRKDDIRRHYIEPFGLDADDIMVITLHTAKGRKKTPVKEQKEYIEGILAPVLTAYGVEYLIVGDGDYFKTLTGRTKVDTALGYVLDTAFGPWKVVYVPTYMSIFYDRQKVTEKIALGITALRDWIAGSYRDPGVDIIRSADYPITVPDISRWLKSLLERPVLTCDIETFSLKHYSAGIGTIAFAWSKHEGIAFPVDYGQETQEAVEIRSLLKEFFLNYRGKLIFHNIAFDGGVLIYQLFMEHLLDNEGLLHGMEVMLHDWEDTKLISYLATNSCAGNELGLKALSQEFAGDYAQDEITDITRIPLPQLLQYNLVDALATFYVYEKNWGPMVHDQQLEIYQTIFKPATYDIIQMQLTGMPVDMDQVRKVKEILESIRDDALERIMQSPIIEGVTHILNERWVEERNSKLKVKRVTLADAKEVFNPASANDLRLLLFEYLDLPVISLTDTKLPSTKGEVIEALKNRVTDPGQRSLLEALSEFMAVRNIISTFMTALENAHPGPDGWHYLFGNFNLGGTVSGRLSSSGPNLQNLPANVFMKLGEGLETRLKDVLAAYMKGNTLSLGKLVKSCFKAPPGWFFGGIDFSSLEDRISALTTKDPNKLKVYEDGYDSHALRAVAYFGEEMPDIDPNSVESVNSIKADGHKYAHLRQESKTPTFLLTYGGTYIGIMEQLGWSKEKAQAVEQRYHELYRVSDEWVSARLDEAARTGYITAAFGLRVRTPLLAQVIRGTSKTPYQAEAEARTAGNALGQSWCLLNSRSGSEFMGKVRKSRFRHDIKPCAQIHDAQYFLIRDDLDAVHFTNIHLVKAVEWQDHPDIWHPTVKLGGEFSLFYPDWSQEIGIPNGASPEEILRIFQSHLDKKQKAA